MKKIFTILLILTFFLPQVVRSEVQKDSVSTLQTFIKKNSRCWSKEVVYEGCNILLCSDGESLLVQFKILHPAIQMRLLMQGLTFYIDPTGRKKEKYSVILPSANDVKEQMQMMEPQRPSRDDAKMQRPDIRPLINSLSKYGAILDINGKSTFIDSGNFVISLNETSASLIYTVLIPVEQMLKEKKLSDKWRIGLYSQGGKQGEGGPGFGEDPEYGHKQTDRQQQMNGNRQMSDSEDMRRLLVKDIEEWIVFSFSEICSLND